MHRRYAGRLWFIFHRQLYSGQKEDKEHQRPEEQLACNKRYEGIVEIIETPCNNGLGIYAS